MKMREQHGVRVPASGPVWIVWHGGSSYLPGDPHNDAEIIESTGPRAYESAAVAALDLMLDRFHNRDGSTPAVDESSAAWVYFSDPSDRDDAYPDALIEWSCYHNGFRYTHA